MDNTATLSKREAQVAELIAWGASKKDIARQLYISERTVENHCRSIYQKANVTKSNELSAWWFCHTYSIPRKVIIAVIAIATFTYIMLNSQAFDYLTTHLK